ncbi:MAG: D-glycero-beta-D-manno-heptose 1-phosphate adenylyltransferase [Deltaproteobacteria bacterium]|nr:D-glycero-beta-D-manno-heptose 1-phosphate adenylyltransferase [Deltaproteobacteria bacterium]
MRAREKVKSIEELSWIRKDARMDGRQVVFTNGCFDLLHIGHIRYLEAARQLGDLLIVAVNSDASVKRIKGFLRPIMPGRERCELVAALQCVDYVVSFESPDPLPLIEVLAPDVLVKGADWAMEDIVGGDVVQREGGRVVRIPLVPNTSSSGIIREIVDRFGH